MKLIVAFCKNRGIGFKNTLPWKLKSDMERFQKLTIGKGNNAVIMGRNTWDSLPDKFKPLPKRTNIILSNQYFPSSQVFSCLEDAKIFCDKKKFDDVWIIGGAMVYKEALDKNLVDWIYTTNIDKDYTCDTFFSKIPSNFITRNVGIWGCENNIFYKYETFSTQVIGGAKFIQTTKV